MFERPRAGERAVLVRLGLGAAVRPRGSRGVRAAGALRGRQAGGHHHRAARNDPIRATSSAAARLQEIAGAARDEHAELILVDHPLSPSQQRNLEQLVGVRVLDRSGLILDIFAQRARSFEGKLEVELAQLKHLSTPTGARLDPS